MEEWTTTNLPGYREKTMQYGNCTIVVFRPELTQQERAKREQQIKTELERGLRDYLLRTAKG